MAEWLRRLTRIEFLTCENMYSDQMGFSRTGSNPVHCEFFYYNIHDHKYYIDKR